MVGTHEVQGLLSHRIGSCLAYKYAGDACTPHTYQTVETAAAIDSGLGLSVAEYDIHDGLSHPYHFARIVCLHQLLVCFVCSLQINSLSLGRASIAASRPS